ncbi:MAG: hypothetical protein MRJ67_17615 [Nitrospirales bacterium]|nr:hypothetical protein [Nitrospira sp.]MDR4462311.1 hypothetical protein [Nitrospirales bacterium]MDR4484599.1 hypothetical protein [Nitrospirales bacterium]
MRQLLFWGSGPGVLVPLSDQTITIPMHLNISVKTVTVTMATNGQDSGVWTKDNRNDRQSKPGSSFPGVFALWDGSHMKSVTV